MTYVKCLAQYLVFLSAQYVVAMVMMMMIIKDTLLLLH